MNKKATIDLPLKTIISLVIAAIFLILLFWLMWLLFSASIPKPDLATLNTFYQILVPAVEKATADEKLVPYYIQPEYELVSRVADTGCCDKCLCIRKMNKPGLFSAKKHFKYNVVIEGKYNNLIESSIISGWNRKSPYGGNVKNVIVWRVGNTVYIKDT
ncbi:MAG: hypothetical protein Q7J54_01475 [Candidatus Woesearchaeota archaeon]|nr:hypothetical protein [Candidatus Woesearchaeota archaeon]